MRVPVMTLPAGRALHWKRIALRTCHLLLGLLLTCSTALAAILLLALLSLTLPNLSLTTVAQTIRAQVSLAQDLPAPAAEPVSTPAPEPVPAATWTVTAQGGGYRLLRVDEGPARGTDTLLTGGGYRLRRLPAAPEALLETCSAPGAELPIVAPALNSSEVPCCCQYLAGVRRP